MVRTAAAALVSAALAAPPAAAQFQRGDVFASQNGGIIQRYNSAGVLVQTLNTGQGGYVTGSAFDAAGNLYVTNFSAGTVSKFNNSGVLQGVFASGFSSPESIVFDQAGNVYIGSLGSGIRKYSATGTLLQTFNTGRVDWMDLAADQRTMLITTESGLVQRYDLVTQTFLSNFSTAGGDFALRILGNGNVMVANDENVLQMNSTGAIVRTYNVGTTAGFFALNLDPDGTSFWTGSFNNANLYKFNIATGALIQTIATGAGSASLYGVTVFGEITQGGPPSVVPEPATVALVAAGIAGMGAVARRHRGADAQPPA